MLRSTIIAAGITVMLALSACGTGELHLLWEASDGDYAACTVEMTEHEDGYLELHLTDCMSEFFGSEPADDADVHIYGLEGA